MAVSRDAAGELSVTLIRVLKMFHGMRQHAPRIHPAVDVGSYPILFNLVSGPRRVSDLADCVHSDVSTVSRQVSHLVSHGIAEKLADPEDRRAQVISLTAEGSALIDQITDRRAEWFQRMLHDWTADDVAGFTAYLERFGAALEESRSQTLARASTSGNHAATTPSKES